MDNQTMDLFADDHEALGQLVDRMDLIPIDELKAKWPQSLADLADVMASELKREGVAEPGVKSRKLALVLAHYLGGRAYYIPTGEKLKAALRDLEIFERWYQNEPMDSIATHYKLSHPQLYVIIAEQRKLHRKRHQPDLFDS